MEFHEQPWFPASWRRVFQDSLGALLTRIGVYRNVAVPFAELLEKTGATAIFDLCSGSAEPVLDLCRRAAARLGRPAPVVHVSDLYPNIAHFEALKARHPGALEYIAEPLDARNIPASPHLPRVRTVFSALHHFRPHEAREILQSAVRDADGVAVFEGQDRSLQSFLSVLSLLPLALLVTPWGLRPWRPLHVLLGLLFPVIPVVLTVDGFTSCLRSYHADELLAMARSLDAPGFHWEAGTAPIWGGMAYAVYLVGWREAGA